jgi:23S rRNA (cytidine1920-2'-O)/16S rRNA (cytidine1409-2'-O)-methyltransferase
VRRRLDLELVRRGLATTQREAAEAILAGRILVEGGPALNPATMVSPADPVAIAEKSRRYVSRGGEKLDAALTRFAIDVEGLKCLDAGAATGGFTDALLAHGAGHVVAVDVAYGQFAWSLRTDSRVTVIERLNVRNLLPKDLPYAPDLVVADLSFISLARVLPSLSAVASDGATFVLLIKPQFEARRDFVEAGGVVRDPAGWHASILTVERACRTVGLGPLEAMVSPLRGPAGNVEFFLHARKGDVGRAVDIEAVVQEADQLRRPPGREGSEHHPRREATRS